MKTRFRIAAWVLGFWFLTVASSSQVATSQHVDRFLYRGDVNLDLSRDVADVTFLLAYLFDSGDAPPCFVVADVDGSGRLDLADATALLAWLFDGCDCIARPDVWDCF